MAKICSPCSPAAGANSESGASGNSSFLHIARTRRLAIDGGRLRSPLQHRGSDRWSLLRYLSPGVLVELRHSSSWLVYFRFSFAGYGGFCGRYKPASFKSTHVMRCDKWSGGAKVWSLASVRFGSSESNVGGNVGAVSRSGLPAKTAAEKSSPVKCSDDSGNGGHDRKQSL
jgi:hypothetical protein